LKKTPGKTINYPFDKPEENHPPGKDSTKKISNIIGKAANFAGSAKSKKVIRNHVMQLLTIHSIFDIMIISFKMATTGRLKFFSKHDFSYKLLLSLSSNRVACLLSIC